MADQDEVEKLEQEVLTISNNAQSQFGGFNSTQLNWKPAPESWSVAQCFEHLITTNAAYFPVLESIHEGKKVTRVVEKLPVLPKLWSKLLIKSLDPKTTRKLKAPPRFQSSSSEIAASIIDDFVAHQTRLAKSMAATRTIRPEKIIITSPAASFITYSLLDAFRILVVHEQRHLQQAFRVTQNPNFPA